MFGAVKKQSKARAPAMVSHHSRRLSMIEKRYEQEAEEKKTDNSNNK